MVRKATLWFITIWTSVLAAVDIVFIIHGVEPLLYGFYLGACVVFQFLAVKRFGDPEVQ